MPLSIRSALRSEILLDKDEENVAIPIPIFGPSPVRPCILWLPLIKVKRFASCPTVPWKPAPISKFVSSPSTFLAFSIKDFDTVSPRMSSTLRFVSASYMVVPSTTYSLPFIDTIFPCINEDLFVDPRSISQASAESMLISASPAKKPFLSKPAVETLSSSRVGTAAKVPIAELEITPTPSFKASHMVAFIRSMGSGEFSLSNRASLSSFSRSTVSSLYLGRLSSRVCLC